MFRHTTAASCRMSVGDEAFTLDERGVLYPEPSALLAVTLRRHPAFVEEEESPVAAATAQSVAESDQGPSIDAAPTPEPATAEPESNTTPKSRVRGRR